MNYLTPGSAIVVKALGRSIEDERDAQTVVAIEAGVVQVITEFRGVAEIGF